MGVLVGMPHRLHIIALGIPKDEIAFALQRGMDVGDLP